MPVLGNGHIGATVYHPYIYLNGLFNGEGGTLFGLYIKNFTETLFILYFFHKKSHLFNSYVNRIYHIWDMRILHFSPFHIWSGPDKNLLCCPDQIIPTIQSGPDSMWSGPDSMWSRPDDMLSGPDKNLFLKKIPCRLWGMVLSSSLGCIFSHTLSVQSC